MGFIAGLLYEHPLSPEYLFAPRLALNYSVNDLTSVEPIDVGYNGKQYDGKFQHLIHATFASLDIGLLFGRRLIDRLIIYAGPQLDMRLISVFDQRETLLIPEKFGTFGNNKRVRNVTTDKDIPNTHSLGFALTAGIGYEFPLNKRRTIRLAPEFFYIYNFTPYVVDSNWNSSGIKLGLALKFSKSKDFPLDIKMNEPTKPIIAEHFSSCDGQKTIFNKKEISFYPKADAKSGLAKWEFLVKSKDKIFTNRSGTNNLPEEIKFDFADDSAYFINYKGEVNYLFKVLDNDDKTKSISGAIAVQHLYNNLSNSISTTFKTDANKESDEAFIKIERTIATNMRPLLNYVFFDRMQTTIPKRYIKLNKNQTEQYNLNELHDQSTLNVYYNILNIVGKRMQDNPLSKITIVGCNAASGVEEGNIELSQGRAEQVRAYFKNVWKIPANRLSISYNTHLGGAPKKPSKPGREKDDLEAAEENRRVEIIPDPEFSAIIDPIITRDTIIKQLISEVYFHPITKTNSGINNWKLDVFHNDMIYKTYSGMGEIPADINFHIDNGINEIIHNPNPFKYILNCSDNKNLTCSCGGEIPVKVVLKDSSLERYSLILFEFNSYEIKSKNEEIANIIRRACKNGAKMSIIGYTDKVGDETSNLLLSKRRALGTASKLFSTNLFESTDMPITDNSTTNIIPIRNIKYDIDNITKSLIFSANGFGEKPPLLYDNSTPEGRFYCRTVTVDVWNPLR
ncbi:MAG: OmpA family protein [Candidatus Kapabacteria bacterium]|nr:OmpA family protein [Candidatus Kapabacteria bacterium]